jgi:hypothetical protein
MDSYIYFHQEVIIKYGVDKMLKPINLGNGALDNVGLSDLRKKLDLCYINIEQSITFKEKLLDYLEEYLIEIRINLIPHRKHTLKVIRKKINIIEKENSNLDEENDVLLEKVNNLKWKLSQEEYILAYLKELLFFIRIWNAEKRKVNKDEYLKNLVDKKEYKNSLEELLKNKEPNKIIKEPEHFYCKVGALFAQNYIWREPADDQLGFDYYYRDIKFTNPNRLSKYIKNEVLKTKRFVNQYIDDTLKGNKTAHNLFLNETKRNKIIEYCKNNDITIKNIKLK